MHQNIYVHPYASLLSISNYFLARLGHFFPFYTHTVYEDNFHDFNGYGEFGPEGPGSGELGI